MIYGTYIDVSLLSWRPWSLLTSDSCETVFSCGFINILPDATTLRGDGLAAWIDSDVAQFSQIKNNAIGVCT